MLLPCHPRKHKGSLMTERQTSRLASVPQSVARGLVHRALAILRSAKPKIVEKTVSIFESKKGELASTPSRSEHKHNVSDASRVQEHKTGSEATIGENIVIEGDVTGDQDLHIEGKLEGSVNLPNQHLVVAEVGQVAGEVTAKVVTICGEVKGKIKGIEKVIISKTGCARGDIVSPRVILEDGAQYKGCIDMESADTEKATSVEREAAEKPNDQAEETD